jgi:hypothetical protein
MTEVKDFVEKIEAVLKEDIAELKQTVKDDGVIQSAIATAKADALTLIPVIWSALRKDLAAFLIKLL